MRVKRITLHGFKTFAQKTEFVFDPGITAIVGPNGSGKSNVADGVRWCLGEQSFSLLRSKKTADVIFSGSDKRARLGMAAVNVILDNSQGEMAIDFDEVEISRRAYRDGDNEYLVNGQKVRLLDVNELLAPSGLGNRTYAVIGQGLIDRVLSLKPEERRSLFEEAAGITGYQSKRGTALRRLDATQQNLTRIQDIVSEISPRLKYLRRQADRYSEYVQIEADLRGQLREWYGFRWHRQLAELAEQQGIEANLRRSVALRQEAVDAVRGELLAIRQRQTELRADVGDLHGVSSDLHRRADQVGRELAVSRERARQLTVRRDETEREIAELTSRRQTAEQRAIDLAEELAAAQHEHDARQERVQALQITLSAHQAERQNLLDQVEQARRRATTLQNRATERSSQLAQAQARRAALTKAQKEQLEAGAAAQAEAERVRQELAQAQSEVSQNESEAADLQAEIRRLEDETKGLQEKLTQAEQNRQAADRAVDRLQTRLDLLERLRNEGAGYASGVKAVLQAGADGQDDSMLAGILGTVASLIRVPAHLDKAIETALGGALQNVVTATWSDSREAIDFLKRTGRGRATFLPLDRLHVPNALDAPRMDGILGNAADLVEFDNRVERAALQLLNRTWIATDLAAARSALDSIRGGGPRPTLVTQDGEIVRPGGSVTGGEDSRRRDDSMLAREREYRELPAQIQAAQSVGKENAQMCSRLIAQSEVLGVQHQAAQETLAALARADRQRRERVEEVRRRLDRAEQSVRWQSDLHTRSSAELAQLQEQEAGLHTELATLEGEIAEAALALTQAETQAEASRADDLLQQMAELKTAAAEALGHLRSRQSLLDDQRSSGQFTQNQIQAKSSHQADLDNSLTELTQKIAELTEKEGQLNLQIEELGAKIDPGERELTQLEQQRTGAEQREQALQQILRRDEATFNSALLKLQRCEDGLGILRREIEHDFGLVALEQSDALADQPPLPLDSMVEHLPVVHQLPDGMEEEVREMRARLQRLGNVNPEALHEYEEASTRHEFLLTQSQDLEAAAADLRKIIAELDQRMSVAFDQTFRAVDKEFVEFFKILFNGGTAKLSLTDPDDLTNTGIEIVARPPGKRPQSLALLSGGERSLTALALIFAILRVSPTPFCILDEVDAALDEANVDRFRDALRSLSNETQFILITHNRRTLETADTIYGITMGGDGVSKVISLRLDGDKIVRNDGGSDQDAERLVEGLVGV